MKKTLIIALCVIVFGVVSFFTITSVIAEQSGSSPNSGVTSRLVTMVNDLITKGYGSVAAGSWGNWGDMWNRIYNAATWVPSDATYNLNASLAPGNVPAGQTFYTGTNRTLQVGTGAYPSNFINQSLCPIENSASPCNTVVLPGSTPIASTWTNTVVLGSQSSYPTQEVWRDNRTGLYWTEDKGSMTNSFTIASCGFFNTTPRGSHWTVGTTCGVAIDYCKNLDQVSIDGNPSRHNWYLPAIPEYQQASNDNIYGLTRTAFATSNYNWSSSEMFSFPTNAKVFYFHNGVTGMNGKGSPSAVRCVSRD